MSYYRIRGFSKEKVNFIEKNVNERGSFFVQFWGPTDTGNFRIALRRRGIIESYCEGSDKNFVYVRYVRK